MSAFPGATRWAPAALAALLACAIGSAPLGAQEAKSDSSSEPVVRNAAVAPGEPSKPPLDPSVADRTPTNGGSTAPSEFKEPPKEEPATAQAPPEPAKPADPLNAALAARLSSSVPLNPRLPAKQREAMQAFYALGEFKPVWIAEHRFTPAATAVIARLKLASEDGLEPNAYPIPPLSAASNDTETAEADLKLSAAALLYARDARGGRINLAGISHLITPTLDLPSADLLLPILVAAGDQAGVTLQGYNPQTPGYVALRSRLAGNRGSAPKGTPSLRIPVGRVLKVGMSDPRVPMLRSHFGLSDRTPGTLDAGPGEPDSYDRDVSDAVAAFQRSHGLPDNGHLTRSTIVALATATVPQTGGGDDAELLVNMERWRWLPGQLGSDYVLVNVPEYRLRVFRNGAVRDETRVIVGKTESPTPLFSGMMEYAVVNPSWFVPPSILKTMLASGRTGGFEVVRRNGQISLRQPPGERNALGFIKFLFPNQHAVYLHDTPNRSLFSAAKRAMSHGCVRVDDPFRFADAVLPEEWTEARLKKLIGKGERTIHLAAKLPVHLAYFTAYVDDNGSYQTLPDLYGYDARMKLALGLGGGSTPTAKGPVESKRVLASVEDPAPRARREVAPAARVREATRATPQRPVTQRVRRSAPDVFGEPGLWTPEPAPSRSRGWW